MSGCVFCGIATAQIPATVVHETERTLAFLDASPQAPMHVLVIPREHHPDVAAVAAADPTLLAELMTSAVTVADRQALTGGYRLLTNTGEDAGQTVSHAHVHVLGGRPLGPLG